MAEFEQDRFDKNSTAAAKPDRYAGENGIECIDVIRDELGENYFSASCIGHCFRYLFRYRKKNGLNDLNKCLDYAKWINVNAYQGTQHNKKLSLADIAGAAVGKDSYDHYLTLLRSSEDIDSFKKSLGKRAFQNLCCATALAQLSAFTRSGKQPDYDEFIHFLKLLILCVSEDV